MLAKALEGYQQPHWLVDVHQHAQHATACVLAALQAVCPRTKKEAKAPFVNAEANAIIQERNRLLA
eukprot:8159806-Lingulodinium_polyedra.AAC.1